MVGVGIWLGFEKMQQGKKKQIKNCQRGFRLGLPYRVCYVSDAR